ncbi:MAG: FAD-dependent oxidoreductase [Candidatus Micrarchaeia archaeon]
MDYDLAIIGCGPAGMSAAMYAGRLGMKTVVFEAKMYGGNMAIAHIIENYPGFERISGIELAEKMLTQVKKAGAQVINEGVIEIKKTDDYFNVITDRNNTYTARSVILATGGEYKRLGIEGEDRFIGKGVSYCPNCDGPLFKNKNVAVIGGGNHAVYGALYLADIVRNVYLVHSERELKAEAARILQLKDKKNVHIFSGYVVVEIFGTDVVTKLKIEEVENTSSKELAVDGVFVCIGEIPLVTLAKSLGVKIDDKGNIVVDSDKATNIRGVFAAGDVTGGIHQIITAAGDGAIAAINALRYLQELKYKKQ